MGDVLGRRKCSVSWLSCWLHGCKNLSKYINMCLKWVYFVVGMLCLKDAFKSCMIAGIWTKGAAEFLAHFLWQGQLREGWWTLRGLWVWINQCTEPGDQGAQGRQMTCWSSLFLKAQLYQVKNTELHVLTRLLLIHQGHILCLSFARYPANWGIWDPLQLPAPSLDLCFPPPLLLILCCHLQIFPSGICSLKVGFC